MFRKTLSLIFIASLLASPAYATQKSRATLESDLSTNLPDNTLGSITPAITRSTLTDSADSNFNTLTDTIGSIAPIGTAGGIFFNSGGAIGSEAVTTALDSAFGSAVGGVLYRSAGGWASLSPGIAGYALLSGGPGAVPYFGSVGGGGGGGTPGGSIGALQFNSGGAFGGVVLSGLLKGNGTSAPTAAVAGTDFAPATAGTSILSGNGSGGFSNVTIGSGLSLSSGTLAATGGSGSGTVNTGTANTLAGYAAAGTAVSSTSITYDSAGDLTTTGTASTGADTITSASASALTVGPNGATNPVLSVDGSTASTVNGMRVTGGATGTGATLSAFGSDAAIPLTISSKGTSGVSVKANNSTILNFQYSTLAFTPAVSTSNNPRFSFIGAPDTSLSASTEAPRVYFNLNQIRSHTTGADPLQRQFRITCGPEAYSTASTLTEGDCLYIDGPPTASTNATLTTAWALNVGSGNSRFAGNIQFTSNEESQVGGTVASASTIAPVNQIQHVSGTTAIATITPPAGMSSTIGGCLTLIADAAWTTTTAGNISAAMTATAGVPYQACFDGSKWYVK